MLNIWKVSEDDVTLKVDHGIKQHEQEIWDISLSPDMKILVMGFGLESVAIWNYQTMQKIIDRTGTSYIQMTQTSFHTVFSKDSSLFAVMTR
jgi:WD40 repeat protein